MEFEDYVRERRTALFRFAVVLSGDPVLADDVVTDVLRASLRTVVASVRGGERARVCAADGRQRVPVVGSSARSDDSDGGSE